MTSSALSPLPTRAWTRKKTTRRSVLIADVVSRVLITAGGVGTIIAVLGVFLFLVYVAFPLFQPAKVRAAASFEPPWSEVQPLGFGVDEYQVIGWALLTDGTLHTYEMESGASIFARPLFGDRHVTCASFLIDGTEAVFGFANGEIQVAELGFKTTFLDEVDLPAQAVEELKRLPRGHAVAVLDGVVQVTPRGQFRHQQLEVILKESIRIAEGPVRRVRHKLRGDGQLIAALVGPDDAVEIKMLLGAEKTSFMTGATKFAFGRPQTVAVPPELSDAPVDLALGSQGRYLYAGYRDGRLARFLVRDLSDIHLVETGRLYASDAELTEMRFILGDATLAWGTSDGSVGAGFPVRVGDFRPGYGLIDAWYDEARADFRFARTKEMVSIGSAVTAMSAGNRSRSLLTGHANGVMQLFNVTSEGLVCEKRVPSGEPILQAAVTPKEDGLVVLTPRRIVHSHMDLMHPEASLKALFQPVWYEGYADRGHLWQSSSATDDFEMKLGLMPLIFGTLKATVYSMMFGAPLALLAAIYSSEFLHPRMRAGIKPTIELMASLPSVVLGFLAALVFAPFVEKIVPAILTVFFTLPFCLLLGALCWQLLPQRFTLRWAHARFFVFLLPIGLGVWMAVRLGPILEASLFGGDIKAWLSWDPARESADPAYAGAVGGWMLWWVPLSIVITLGIMQWVVEPRLRALSRQLDRRRLAYVSLAKFAAGCALTIGLALFISWVLSALGFDARGSYIDTYVQRNSLVVGMVMGFAIIPIIYTISDDALSTVPDHLRGASLGAGATKWQTAMRVVIPTAMSGLFSALMIGLGRAVGETMIVLMATGNTPVMDWNIFEGFRTLSANIAVELPEAVKDSTHYRTLFMAALVLFAMTFVVNTVAEIVRLRFRKKAHAL